MKNLYPLALTALIACDDTSSSTPAPEPTPEPAPVVAPEPAPVPEPAPSVAQSTVSVGPFVVTPVYHGTAMIQYGEVMFWLDPWSKGALDGKPKADVVLLTDVHPDHMDEAAIAMVSGPEVVKVAPSAVAETIVGVQHVLSNGSSVEVRGVIVTAVPMYNLQRGPESGGVYHEKGRGNGYILEAEGTRIYFAGDTECTDEMRALKGIDAAFLPMNLPYTMTPEEAAGCVAAFRPKKAIPYHYAGSSLSAFGDALLALGAGAEGVAIETVEFYPGGLPW